jgi:uncharacterized membrane protein YsdA (DUF1294 family)
MLNPFYLILIILALVNTLGLILVGFDKRKSYYNEPRVPEVYFFVIAIFFASLGVLVGMSLFRHKIRKWYFPTGIGLLLAQQIALLYLFSSYYLKLQIIVN